MKVAVPEGMRLVHCLVPLSFLLAACSSGEGSDEGNVDGRTMSTTVYVENRTSETLTAEWEIVVENPSDSESPMEIAPRQTVGLGTESDWGRLPVWEIVPGLLITDDEGQVIYELPDSDAFLPDDPRWTLDNCGYPQACKYTLLLEE